MPDVVRELAMTVAAVKKLGARGISEREVEQLTGNRYVIVANRGRTPELTSWAVVTGWNSTEAERKILARKG